jgi:tRNA U55 pseudouridine synthase TruB
VGVIAQVPPAFSALHVNGERAYRKALRGEEPQLAARNVIIESLALIEYKENSASFLIRCSAGTYIRSLARDIAKACGSCATVQELQRTKVGPFSIDEALSLDNCDVDTLRPFTLSLAQKLGFVVGILSSRRIENFCNGRTVPSSAVTFEKSDDSQAQPCGILLDHNGYKKTVALFSLGVVFLGVGERKDSFVSTKIVALEKEHM